MTIPFAVSINDRYQRAANVSFYHADYCEQGPHAWRNAVQMHLVAPHIHCFETNAMINHRADLFAFDESYGKGNRARRRVLVIFEQGRMSTAEIIKVQDLCYLSMIPHTLWPDQNRSPTV